MVADDGQGGCVREMSIQEPVFRQVLVRVLVVESPRYSCDVSSCRVQFATFSSKQFYRWEVYLAHNVVPKQTKVLQTGQYVEINLKKRDGEWKHC